MGKVFGRYLGVTNEHEDKSAAYNTHLTPWVEESLFRNRQTFHCDLPFHMIVIEGVEREERALTVGRKCDAYLRLSNSGPLKNIGSCHFSTTSRVCF